jgi:TonB family protein
MFSVAGNAQPADQENAVEQQRDSTAVETVSSTPEVATRFETSIEFTRLVDEERFEEALPIGGTLIELTEQEFGRNSTQTAQAYTQFAQAQHRAGEYELAAESFLQSIEIYREIDGTFSPLIIAPLTSLGDSYHEGGDHLSAVSAYSEARTVNRRAYGLLNEDQIPLLDRMTQSLLGLNELLEADLQQLEALRLVERNWPPESEEALAAIYKYAGWLRDSGRYQEEREQYARALRIIRERFGKADPQQVRPLVGIGNSFRNQRIPEGQGVGALRDALALLLAQEDPNRLAIAEVLRDLGDWEVAFNKVGYDGAEYRRAWQVLGNVDNGESLRDSWFNGPAYVLREPISQRGLSQEQDALPGHVLVKFDLDATGRSANVTVVESDPPGLKDESVLRHIRRSRFRPQMANGELVPGEELALQFNYRYTPDENPEQDEEDAQE